MLYMLLWHTLWGSLVGQYAGSSKKKKKVSGWFKWYLTKLLRSFSLETKSWEISPSYDLTEMMVAYLKWKPNINLNPLELTIPFNSLIKNQEWSVKTRISPQLDKHCFLSYKNKWRQCCQLKAWLLTLTLALPFKHTMKTNGQHQRTTTTKKKS